MPRPPQLICLYLYNIYVRISYYRWYFLFIYLLDSTVLNDVELLLFAYR